MRRISILLLLLFILGCTKDNLNPGEPERLMEITVNDETILLTGNDEAYGNKNCDIIFLNKSFLTSAYKNHFSVELEITTAGELKTFKFYDYSDKNRHFQVNNFNSADKFVIKDFKYDPQTKSLYFEYSGTLYEVDKPQNTKPVRGKFKINNLKEIECTYVPWVVNAMVDDTPFRPIEIFGNHDDVNKSRWFAYANNGLKLTITTATHLRTMPVGTYTFKRGDTMNTILIEKFIGPYYATTPKIVFENEWERYETEGILTITEQVGGKDPHAKGSFSFKAYKNNQVVYQISNGRFSI